MKLLCCSLNYPILHFRFLFEGSTFYWAHSAQLANRWIPRGTTTTNSQSLVVIVTLSQNPELPRGSRLEMSKFMISSIVWLVMNSPLFRITSPLNISLSSMVTCTLAHTIESLRIGEALNTLNFGYKFVNSKYRTPKNCKFKLSTSALV
jgi:hypothetical protein